VIGRQFVFEFVNATYHGRSTVVIAPDFQSLPGFQADADINRLHGSRQISAGGMTSPVSDALPQEVVVRAPSSYINYR
jgi:hypothetical protein